MLLVAAYMLCCGNDWGSPWAQQPPPQFNHAYHGHLTVKTGTREQIHQWCGWNARACAMPRGNSCTIILPALTPGASPEVILSLRNHEIGHCNGWPANHP